MFNNLRSNNSMHTLIFFLCLLFASNLTAQNQSREELKKQMAKIRQSTDWNDPVAAKKANDEIKILSKQLMMSGKNQTPTNESDSLKLEQEKENVDYKMKLWSQMQESAKLGEGGDILLAEPLRKEIREDYEEDESPKNITPEFFQEMSVLVIDMSLPTVQRTIDIMQNYKSITTLVITGGEHAAAVNLQDLLMRALSYPLKNLYIINFRNFVSNIPEQVNQFKSLQTLGVFNNKINLLPKSTGFLSSLDSLHLDINPISTLFPAINSMNNLKTLSLAKTSVSDAEIKKIKQLLPNCEVIVK